MPVTMGLLQVRAQMFFPHLWLRGLKSASLHLLFSLDFVGPRADEFGLNIFPLIIYFIFLSLQT
jgi:hypothetical protein